MKNAFVKYRNLLEGTVYRTFLKPIFFKLDPEDAHDYMSLVGRLLGSNSATRFLCRLAFGYSHPMLEQTILGIHFKNPLGLSAGFDKNAHLTNVIPTVGFGFEEVGSVTGEPCAGNPKPRLWRHPKEKSLRVYYGLLNDGAERIAARLKNKQFRFPVGISVAKTNCKETCEVQAGIDDYVKAFKAFVSIGDYLTVNLSCPNAFGGQPFTDPARLHELLKEIDKIPTKKPLFLKLSPDLSDSEVDELLNVVEKHRVHGFICTNLTKKHTYGVGGLSGKAVDKLSTHQIAHLYKKTKNKYVIIGNGGIFTAQDAYAKLKAGASLLQLITGMIYEGPQQISEINRGLVELMKKDGVRSLAELPRD